MRLESSSFKKYMVDILLRGYENIFKENYVKYLGVNILNFQNLYSFCSIYKTEIVNIPYSLL